MCPKEPVAVTKDISRANRAKTAFQLCKHRCLLGEVIASELAGAWVEEFMLEPQVGGLQSSSCPLTRLDVVLIWITKFKQPECHPRNTDSK